MDQPIEPSSNCPICLNVVEEHMKCITQCGHTFHNRCIFRWLRNHNNCPTCRCVLNADDTDGETDGEMVTPPLEEVFERHEEIRNLQLEGINRIILQHEQELMDLQARLLLNPSESETSLLHNLIQQEELHIELLHNAHLDVEHDIALIQSPAEVLPRRSVWFGWGNESLVARSNRRQP